MPKINYVQGGMILIMLALIASTFSAGLAVALVILGVILLVIQMLLDT